MLSDPNDESPANLDAAIQWRTKRLEYNKRCHSLVEKANADLPKDFEYPAAFEEEPAHSCSSFDLARDLSEFPDDNPDIPVDEDEEDDEACGDEDGAIKSSHGQYEQQLKQLTEMGLNISKAQTAKCIRLLDQYHGELEKVTEQLLPQ
jgi:hypothetical protein